MDTLTHAISGAVIGIATAQTRDVRTLRRRALWGALFAAFPDSDVAMLLFTDHFTYLNAHRGLTHSILLLPVWAALLGWLAARVSGERWRDAALLAAAALGAHILGDLITSYGTRVFAPVYDAPLAFPITFIIDPFFTGILLIGLIAALWKKRPAFAAASGAVLAAYLLLQTTLHFRAAELGREYADTLNAPAAVTLAFPQPLSPFNWKIVVAADDGYHRSYVNLLARDAPERVDKDAGLFARLRAAYRPADTLHWQLYPRWPRDTEHRRIAQEAWSQPALAGFRRFALLPYVTAMRGDEREVCVWFADLRFTLHGMKHPFEYAMCRGDDVWTLEFDKLKNLGRP